MFSNGYSLIVSFQYMLGNIGTENCFFEEKLLCIWIYLDQFCLFQKKLAICIIYIPKKF